MALKRIGAKFEHYRVVEFDKYAIASYNAVHGTDFPTMDITKVHAEDLNICDTNAFTYLLTYSFPCTDLSVAGKQAGMSKGSGTRSGLLWEVERILTEIRDSNGELPQILFMENVPQVHSQDNMPDFRKWLDFLESLGYTNYYQDLNAKNYGVAQNRERCFMFSFLGEYNYHFPQPIPLKKKLKDYLEDNVDEKYYINNEKADRLIKQLIDNGTLPQHNLDRQTDRQTDRLALTEQSISRSKEKLQTVSRQDMTAEYQTCGQAETLLLKGMVDKNIEPTASVIDVSVAIMSRDYKGPNNYGTNGVIEWK
jgi:DNA-cytosine methyltransferase